MEPGKGVGELAMLLDDLYSFMNQSLTLLFIGNYAILLEELP